MKTILFFCLFLACSTTAPRAAQLVEIANLGDRQPTGLAISKTGRVFVCFPRWESFKSISVAEFKRHRLYPFPKEWKQAGEPPQSNTSAPPLKQWISVQSIVIDDRDRLWILDTGSPDMKSILQSPKLVGVDLTDGEVFKIIPFDAGIAPGGSYLNDVRIDTERNYAYLTDSGRGGLVVVNLETGTARRVLEEHPSTRATSTLQLEVEGRPLIGPDGAPPQIHVDGLELTSDRNFLYYHALTGQTLYKIETEALRDERMPAEELAARVQTVAPTQPSDGMAMASDGNVYLTSFTDSSILRVDSTGNVSRVIQDDRLLWPDTLAFSPEGALFVSCSQLQYTPRFNDGKDLRTTPYKIYKVVP